MFWPVDVDVRGESYRPVNIDVRAKKKRVYKMSIVGIVSTSKTPKSTHKVRVATSTIRSPNVGQRII